jgi:deoxyhypusine monooxygenase
MFTVQEANIEQYKNTLKDTNEKIQKRTQNLFFLRSLASVPAVEALKEAFRAEPESDLLRHEICYCLGQMNSSPEVTEAIQAFLEEVVSEGLENKHAKIVVHEAVEALGNLCQDGSFDLLKKYISEEDDMVKETVFLAEKMMQWLKETNEGKTEFMNLKKLKFKTNDPAPPFNYIKEPQYKDIQLLEEILINKSEEHDLFHRYRAMFTLRELNTPEAAESLCKPMLKEHSATCGALLKHEISFVVAQMEDVFDVSIPYLLESINNCDEAPVVKHESLIALGDMVTDVKIFEPFLTHPELVVS